MFHPFYSFLFSHLKIEWEINVLSFLNQLDISFSKFEGLIIFYCFENSLISY
ncbi:hypothetical protein LEP1GSC202_3772 [Leptospira yanagawae serovar Saopaulo str. Sao Paulo = ATCC 700523]|uniref:Uncharacterized protein n=1 Tax=Leptospira yanagawae serovar Saopaulo str. Sao Paulo = ATCC 700523 TaxID=1249483 RepID=A0A5E8HG15_9LEPT|nr:hypothetical protein LEP1GSC202_3772 [Leptospira yanagawae serovar Saopaulo str. Sao Paulo = ATCC 700523]